MACACVDVEMGSYGNQIEVAIPAHMVAYRAARVVAGLSPTICLDRCLAGEVQALWALGIATTGCCCGHNVAAPFIGVVDADIGRMKSLGYRVQANASRPGDEDSFTPKGSS